MTTFNYKAKKGTSETVTGQITAHNQDEAIELITQLGLLPVSVYAQMDSQSSNENVTRKKIKSKDLFLFSRQLANLLRSGVSLLRSLKIMEQQTENKYFRRVIADVALDVKNGKTFSGALQKYPEHFSLLYLTMVRAGEEGSNLQEMLVNVALYQKRQEEIKSKIRSALSYPIFMAGVGCLTVYFILTFVLPKMSGLFDSMGGELPLPTRLMLSISGALNAGGLWTVILLALLSLGIVKMAKTVKGREYFSKLLLNLPFVGGVIIQADIAKFAKTMVLLLRSDVSITRSLDIAIPILSNQSIREELAECKTALISGGSFGENLLKSKNIPEILGHLISVGEESGNIVDVLDEIADNYEQETDEKIKTLTTLIEPILILSVGLVIGFIVFAMLLPIFQIDVLSQ